MYVSPQPLPVESIQQQQNMLTVLYIAIILDFGSLLSSDSNLNATTESLPVSANSSHLDASWSSKDRDRDREAAYRKSATVYSFSNI